MSRDPIYTANDGRVMARCPDCNKVCEVKQGSEHVIEVGAHGQVTGVICDECWRRIERSGGKLS